MVLSPSSITERLWKTKTTIISNSRFTHLVQRIHKNDRHAVEVWGIALVVSMVRSDRPRSHAQSQVHPRNCHPRIILINSSKAGRCAPRSDEAEPFTNDSLLLSIHVSLQYLSQRISLFEKKDKLLNLAVDNLDEQNHCCLTTQLFSSTDEKALYLLIYIINEDSLLPSHILFLEQT